MLSLRSLDPLSGEVNSLATTAADSIVSRLLSEDSAAPSELSVLDISLRTFRLSVSRKFPLFRITYVPYCVRITHVLRMYYVRYSWLGAGADFSFAAAARRLALLDRSCISRRSNSFRLDFSLTF